LLYFGAIIPRNMYIIHLLQSIFECTFTLHGSSSFPSWWNMFQDLQCFQNILRRPYVFLNPCLQEQCCWNLIIACYCHPTITL
jgi:hypothetical protein